MMFEKKRFRGLANQELIDHGRERFREARAQVRRFAPSETSTDACAQSLLCLRAEHRPVSRAAVLARAEASYPTWFLEKGA